jgi:hypothetical protein
MERFNVGDIVEMVSVIEKYLGRNFPGCQVEEEHDVGKSGQYLRIIKGTELRHRVLVARGFLQDHTPEEIVMLLTEWRVPEQIRMAGTVLVLITNRGVR